nr:hypothetical protein GCM10020093_097370 [Planobispora longispora]
MSTTPSPRDPSGAAPESLPGPGVESPESLGCGAGGSSCVGSGGGSLGSGFGSGVESLGSGFGSGVESLGSGFGSGVESLGSGFGESSADWSVTLGSPDVPFWSCFFSRRVTRPETSFTMVSHASATWTGRWADWEERPAPLMSRVTRPSTVRICSAACFTSARSSRTSSGSIPSNFPMSVSRGWRPISRYRGDGLSSR